jgi:hypothetical protein
MKVTITTEITETHRCLEWMMRGARKAAKNGAMFRIVCGPDEKKPREAA